MAGDREAALMVKYQFEIDDEKWDAWKNTVPRSKSLEKRIIELIEADTEGRVRLPGGAEPDEPAEDDIAASGVSESAAEPEPEPERTSVEKTEPQESGLGDVERALKDVEFPATKDRETCVEAVCAAYEYLQEHGKATMREFVQEVMPEHPVGYDVPDLEPGERYRGAWWRKVVKPGLTALPDVESPPRGGSDWTHTGDDDE